MTLLNDKDRKAVREQLDQGLQRQVTMALFTSAENCELCDVTGELVEEIAGIHPLLRVTRYDLAADAGRAAELGVDKAPAIVVLGGEEARDYGVRFYGIPSGYEFITLLEALRMVGSDSVELQPATRTFLDELTQPVHLQVFVTPGCPYCPRAGVLAHRLAYASPLVSADVVEVSEFPELGERYEVMGVPRTVIDDVVHIEGAAPEGMLLSKLREALAA
ncbi:MAG: thioredoxin family protein [Chloroflexi bacterium]|nr:thioredoxin family protein [Chloroflexota bacterium]